MKPLKGSWFSVNIGGANGKKAKIIKWTTQIVGQNVFNNIIPSMFKIIIKGEMCIYWQACAHFVI